MAHRSTGLPVFAGILTCESQPKPSSSERHVRVAGAGSEDPGTCNRRCVPSRTYGSAHLTSLSAVAV